MSLDRDHDSGRRVKTSTEFIVASLTGAPEAIVSVDGARITGGHHPRACGLVSVGNSESQSSWHYCVWILSSVPPSFHLTLPRKSPQLGSGIRSSRVGLDTVFFENIPTPDIPGPQYNLGKVSQHLPSFKRFNPNILINIHGDKRGRWYVLGGPLDTHESFERVAHCCLRANPTAGRELLRLLPDPNLRTLLFAMVTVNLDHGESCSALLRLCVWLSLRCTHRSIRTIDGSRGLVPHNLCLLQSGFRPIIPDRRSSELTRIPPQGMLTSPNIHIALSDSTVASILHSSCLEVHGTQLAVTFVGERATIGECDPHGQAPLWPD